MVGSESPTSSLLSEVTHLRVRDRSLALLLAERDETTFEVVTSALDETREHDLDGAEDRRRLRS